MIYDVIISGLGPAGSTAAYQLAKAGLKVLAFDKAGFPRYKACGGGISPKVKRILSFSIDELVEDEADTIKLTHCLKNEFTVKSTMPVGHMLMRDKFDYFLLTKAKSAGSLIKEQEKVIDFKENKETVEVITDKNTYEASFFIGADGANSLVAEKSGLAQRRKNYFTLTAELKVPLKKLEENRSTIWIDIGKVPRGCGWIFPKKNHFTLGIGLFYSKKGRVKDPRFFIYEFINKHPALRGAELQGKIHGHYIATLTDDHSFICGDRIFLVGEAAGLVDPFTGEGIYCAIRSSQILAGIISGNMPLEEIKEKYWEEIKKEFISEFKMAEYISRFVYTFPKYSHNLLLRHRHLGDYYQGLLRGDVSYGDVYSRMLNKMRLNFKEKANKFLSVIIRKKTF